jgi:hypothetical protein
MFDKQLPPLILNVNGIEELIDPNPDLAIYDSDLNKEFAEQAPRFAFYGGLYTDSLTILESYKNDRARYEADNEPEMRKRIQARFGESERITEAKLESEYSRDDQWQMLTKAIYEWEKVVRRLDVYREAFKQRAQMLWNIGSTRRQEMMRLSPHDNEQ